MNHSRQREWRAGRYDAGAIDQALAIHFALHGAEEWEMCSVCADLCVHAMCTYENWNESERAKKEGVQVSVLSVVKEVNQVPFIMSTTPSWVSKNWDVCVCVWVGG